MRHLTPRQRRVGARVLIGGMLVACAALGILAGRTIRDDAPQLVAPRPDGALVAAVPEVPHPSGTTPAEADEADGTGASTTAVREGEEAEVVELPPQLTPLIGTTTAPLTPDAAVAAELARLEPLERPDFGEPTDPDAGPSDTGAETPESPGGATPASGEPTSPGTPGGEPVFPLFESTATTSTAEVAVFVDPCTVDPSGCPVGTTARIGADRPPALRPPTLELQSLAGPEASEAQRGECGRRFGVEGTDDLYLEVITNRPVSGRLEGTFQQGRGERVELDVQLSDVAAQRWDRDWRVGIAQPVSHCVRIAAEVWQRNLGAHADQQYCFVVCHAWLDGRLRVTGPLRDSDGTVVAVDTTLGIPAGRDRDAELAARRARSEIVPLTPTTLAVRTPSPRGERAVAALFPWDTDCSTYDPTSNTPQPISVQLGRPRVDDDHRWHTSVVRLPDDLPGIGLYRLCVFVVRSGARDPRDSDIERIEEHVVSPPAAARYDVRVYPRGDHDLGAVGVDIRLERGDDDANPFARAGLLTDRCALTPGGWSERIRPADDPNLLCTASSRSVFPDSATEGVVHVTVTPNGGPPATQPIRLHSAGCVSSAASCAEADHPLVFPEALVVVSRRLAAADVPSGVFVTARNEWQIDHTEPAVVRSSQAVGTARPDPVLIAAPRAVTTPYGFTRQVGFDRPVEFVEGAAIPHDADMPAACTRPIQSSPASAPQWLAIGAEGLCANTAYGTRITVRNPATGRSTSYSSLMGPAGDTVPAPQLNAGTAAAPAIATEAVVEVVSVPRGFRTDPVLILRADAALDGRTVATRSDPPPSGPAEDGYRVPACGPLAQLAPGGLIADGTTTLSFPGPHRLRVSLDILEVDDPGAASGLTVDPCVTNGQSVPAFIAQTRATQRELTFEVDRFLFVGNDEEEVTVLLQRPDGLAVRVTLR